MNLFEYKIFILFKQLRNRFFQFPWQTQKELPLEKLKRQLGDSWSFTCRDLGKDIRHSLD